MTDDIKTDEKNYVVIHINGDVDSPVFRSLGIYIILC